MTKVSNSWWSRLAVLFLLILLGCKVAGEDLAMTPTVPPFDTQADVTGTSTDQPSAVTETATSLSVEQQSPTTTPGQVKTPSPQPAATRVPATATQSSWQQTLTPIPGLTPLPTILPELRQQTYEELMATNNGCELPCWWGMILGESKITEARTFYESFSVRMAGRSWENGAFTALTIYFSEIESIVYPSRQYVAAENDVIYTMYIEAGRVDKYQIEPLLQVLGEPAEIWMWTHPEPAFDNAISINLILFFPEQGTFVFYDTHAQRVEESVEACFQEQGQTYFDFWLPELRNPDGTKTLSELLEVTSFVFTLENMHPIQDVSNWDVTQFFTTLVDPNHTDCLETPADIWPSRF